MSLIDSPPERDGRFSPLLGLAAGGEGGAATVSGPMSSSITPANASTPNTSPTVAAPPRKETKERIALA